jgi:hypothetical protein
MSARALAIFLVALLLAGCANRPPPNRATAATAAACRQRADEVFARQNRAEVYNSDTYDSSIRDAPFASSGLPGITTRGLGSRYARDKYLDDCIRNAADRGSSPPPNTAP